MDKELLTTREVAEYLGVAIGTVRTYTQQGLLKPVGRSEEKKGNPLMFPLVDVDKFKQQAVVSNPETYTSRGRSAYRRIPNPISRTERKHLAGLCVSCGVNTPPPGYRTCQKCRDGIKKSGIERKVRRVKNNLCTRCGEPTDNNRKHCQACRQKDKEAHAYQRQKREAQGLCTDCGKQEPRGGSRSCTECIKKKYNKEKERKRERREKGLCIDCGKPVCERSQYCFEHWKAAQKRTQYWKFEGNRIKALERDGFQCRICGDDGRGKRELHVHHIDSNSTNNTLDNLMCLCQKCHNAVTDLLACPDPFRLIQFMIDQYLSKQKG